MDYTSLLNEMEVNVKKRIRSLETEDHDTDLKEEMDIMVSIANENTRLAILEREKEQLNKIKLAKSMCEQGTYGICEECGEKISERRLRAMPTVTLCVSCQEEMEND